MRKMEPPSSGKNSYTEGVKFSTAQGTLLAASLTSTTLMQVILAYSIESFDLAQ